ncbi:hypothetical protein ENBRE01_1305 [Enteropsectra breve]|nr:hypothetical protein ENBRE01_1305 [Enteropsectra breve]
MDHAFRSQILIFLLILVPIFSVSPGTSLPSSFLNIESALYARIREDPPKVYYRMTLITSLEVYRNYIFAIDDGEEHWQPVYLGDMFKLTRPGYETEALPFIPRYYALLKTTCPWSKWESNYLLLKRGDRFVFFNDMSYHKINGDKGTEDFSTEKYIEAKVYRTSNSENATFSQPE